MARYREIADDLRQRITGGEFQVGGKLPSITELKLHYGVPGLNTIRASQQMLVDEGLIETLQGKGAFVISTSVAPRSVDVLAELRIAHGAIARAIAGLERQQETDGRASA